jgi:hypothetical protein
MEPGAEDPCGAPAQLAEICASRPDGSGQCHMAVGKRQAPEGSFAQQIKK